MKTNLTLLTLAALALPLSAKEETEYEKWSRIGKELSDENSRRFREGMYHDEIVKQQERIHRENVVQRERIAADTHRQLERIERTIPRVPEYRVRDYYHIPPCPPIR